jgi:hypothetical protein
VVTIASVSYHLSEGSEMFPLSILQSLERKRTPQGPPGDRLVPFTDNLARYGFIPDDKSDRNIPRHEGRPCLSGQAARRSVGHGAVPEQRLGRYDVGPAHAACQPAQAVHARITRMGEASMFWRICASSPVPDWTPSAQCPAVMSSRELR